MLEQVFVLRKTRPYKRTVRVFIKNKFQKVTSVNCLFTTEHLVNEQERQTGAKTRQAEFSTSNPELYEAMLCDSSYGKDFYLKGDPEGKLKKKTVVLTRDDVDMAAMEKLYKDAGMNFDHTRSFLELQQAYKFHMEAMGGRRFEPSKPAEIAMKVVDVAGEIQAQKQVSMANYEAKYGEPVPEIVAGDVAFLDAMQNMDFDAQKYIAARIAKHAVESEVQQKEMVEKPNEDSFDVLDAKYFERFKTHIPNNKKSDLAWVKNKLNN